MTTFAKENEGSLEKSQINFVESMTMAFIE